MVAVVCFCARNFRNRAGTAAKNPPSQKNIPADGAGNIGAGHFVPFAQTQSDEELLAAIERIARQNPSQAMELALAENNPRLRRRLIRTTLHIWAKTAAAAAADWILSQSRPELNQTAFMAALFDGLADDPSAAAELVRHINEKYPSQAGLCGGTLIAMLDENPDSSHATLVASAFGVWANYQPENAAASAMKIADDNVRSAALDAVISTWEQIRPQGVADFAEANLPASNQKTLALSQSLVFWAAQNPAAAANWINQFGPSAQFDQGEAAIATQQQTMQQPNLALSWAQIITDPNLRSRTISAIVETWTLSDPAAALNFTQNSADLLPDDRTALLGKLVPH